MPAAAPPDRRAFPRSPPLPEAAADCRLVGGGPNAALALIDVSAAGCQLHLAEGVEPGRVLALSFRSARRPAVRVVGRAVWCRPHAPAAWAAGVAFDRRLRADELAALTVPGPGPLARPLAAARAGAAPDALPA